MSTPEKNIIETALEAGRQLTLDTIYENGTPMLLIPKDYTLQRLDDLRDWPIRIQQSTRHTTAQSFINYFRTYADEDSAIFIDEINHQSALAILDYHAPAQADWKQHTAVFDLVKTPEWETWLQHNKKPKTQAEFGAFIEDNLPDIVAPTGAEMLEIALGIQAKTEVKFSSGIRLDNGQTQLTYNETIDGAAGAKGQLKIPEKFSIGLKLFRGDAPYQLDARLRYRIKDGNLSIWYELIRPHITVDANINDTIALIEQGINNVGHIYRGTPGA